MWYCIENTFLCIIVAINGALRHSKVIFGAPKWPKFQFFGSKHFLENISKNTASLDPLVQHVAQQRWFCTYNMFFCITCSLKCLLGQSQVLVTHKPDFATQHLRNITKTNWVKLIKYRFSDGANIQNLSSVEVVCYTEQLGSCVRHPQVPFNVLQSWPIFRFQILPLKWNLAKRPHFTECWIFQDSVAQRILLWQVQYFAWWLSRGDSAW